MVEDNDDFFKLLIEIIDAGDCIAHETDVPLFIDDFVHYGCNTYHIHKPIIQEWIQIIEKN